jgi:integrase
MRGHVRRRGKSWSFVIDVGHDRETGKRRQRWSSGHPTRKAAEEAMRRALGRLDTGQEPIPEKITLHEHVETWLAHLESQGKPRPSSRRRYADLLHGYVVPLIGSVQLAKLRPAEVQTCLDAMTAAGLAPATVSKARAAISSCLQWALRMQLVNVNVARPTSTPPVSKPDLSIPSAQELRAAADAAIGTTWEVPVLLAVTTGARRSEVLAVHWSGVDLDAATVRIDQGLARVDGTLTFQQPKTSAGRRVVPLRAWAVERLRAHKAEQARRRLSLGEAWVDLDLVCERGDGAPLDPSAFTHGWARLARVVGLEGVRLHDVRHAVATAYARSGARPSVTAAILGHANPGFTSRVYEHPDDAMLREAAEAAARLDALDQ